MDINKMAIIVNMLIAMWSCYKASLSLFISYSMNNYILVHDIRFEMSDDKKLYEKTLRVFLYFMILTNLILFLTDLTRVIQDFAPYSTKVLILESFIFHLVLLTKTHILLTLFRGQEIKFIKNKRI